MSWYKIKAVGSKTAEIEIDGEIGYEVTARQFCKDLRALGKRKEIHARINTPGGDTDDGFVITNAIIDNPARVIMRVDTLAASMGSVILQGADERVMPMTSEIMIHNPEGYAFGQASDLRKQADRLDSVRNSLIYQYTVADRLKISKKKLGKLLDAETWMSAIEALEMGFVDRIEGQPQLGVANFANFNYTERYGSITARTGLLFDSARRSSKIHISTIKDRGKKPMSKTKKTRAKKVKPVAKYTQDQLDAAVKKAGSVAVKSFAKASKKDVSAASARSAEKIKARYEKLLAHKNSHHTKVVNMLASGPMKIKDCLVYMDQLAAPSAKAKKRGKKDSRENLQKAALAGAQKAINALKKKSDQASSVLAGSDADLDSDDVKAQKIAAKAGRAAAKRRNKRNVSGK